MNSQNTDPRADACWKDFWHSGRVEDYLKYRNAAGEPDGIPDEEKLHADSNRRAGSAGTQTG